MIKEIRIRNFKSIADIRLSLGTVNVFIGSNGSGKSNILEAIAFGGAATADKLDNEYFGSRGIRTSDSILMKNAFNPINSSIPIQLSVITNDKSYSFTIEEDKDNLIPKWIFKEKQELEGSLKEFYKSLLGGGIEQSKLFTDLSDNEKDKLSSLSGSLQGLLSGRLADNGGKDYISTVSDYVASQIYKENLFSKEIENFIIYSPEISSLRKFEEESQIKPLGIKGEGLFSVLQIFNESYGKETITELKEYLQAIEWFEDFEAKYDTALGRKVLVVKDRYIPNTSLNQNNVNEGFLFLLFYISLLISNETPSFFAIDNIEASFHPKLCEDLIKNMVKLAKAHNKQIILTTHNPFVLDGLDLNDPDQRLFVVRRNADGETIADKIDKQPVNVKLSDAWLKGYIGGNPETIE